MAEGARLESVWAGNRLVGSNPTPSASQRQSPREIAGADILFGPIAGYLGTRRVLAGKTNAASNPPLLRRAGE